MTIERNIVPRARHGGLSRSVNDSDYPGGLGILRQAGGRQEMACVKYQGQEGRWLL